MVDSCPQSINGQTLLISLPIHSGHNGCQSLGLGSSLPRTANSWPMDEDTKKFHINQLEMLAIMKAFQAFLPRIEGRAVQLVMDNTATMHYINR